VCNINVYVIVIEREHAHAHTNDPEPDEHFPEDPAEPWCIPECLDLLHI
jgi:hypothetical protein